MIQQTIRISKKLLAFREDAMNIKKESKKISSDILIDFSEVHFVSRAFADEFLNVIEEIKAEGKKINFIKMYPDVRKMLKLVKNGRKKIKKELEGII